MTDTKVKSNTVVTAAFKADTQTLVFKVLGAGELYLSLNALSEANRHRAMLHGLEQRVRDAAAIPFAANKRYPTPQDKYEAMKKLVDHYNTGTAEWAITRTLERKSDYTSGLLELALQRYKPERTKDEVRAAIAKLTPVQRTALLNDPKIKPIADAIQEEQREALTDDIDTDALLNDL